MSNTAGYLPSLLGPVVIQASGEDQTPAASINFAGAEGSYDANSSTLTLTPGRDDESLSLGAIRTRVAQLQTTDDTETTLLSYTMLDESVAAFDVVVTAARRSAATKAARYKRSVVYRRTGGGNATIVGTLESGTDQETDAGWDVTIDTSTTAVRVRVTGAAATSLNWTCECRIQETLAT